MRYLLSGLTTGLVVIIVSLILFVSILVPQMSIGQDQARTVKIACLRTFFGQATPSSHATPLISTPVASSTAEATSCVGNQAIVQAALTIVAHLHGDPDVNWDAGMPEQVVNYWASTCPPGSGCWIDWQNTNLQCVMLVKGAYALSGAPLPAVSDAIGFWTLYANRTGWSEIPSSSTPRHLPLPGDIVVWSHATLGHVAIVTAVIPPANGHSGSMTFAQANHTGSFLNGQFVPGLVTQTMNPDLSVLTWPSYHIMGYIRSNSVYLDLAAQDARVAGIDPILFERQIQVESGFNPNAISPTGAVGIAQFLPSTAAGLTPPLDPTDPVASLAAAAQDMASKVRTYGGDDAKALAAYNAGDTVVQDAVAMSGANWLQHVPTQTIMYVNSIMNHP